MIKRFLYMITGMAWGICTANKDILCYAIFLTIITIVFELVLDDSED